MGILVKSPLSLSTSSAEDSLIRARCQVRLVLASCMASVPGPTFGRVAIGQDYNKGMHVDPTLSERQRTCVQTCMDGSAAGIWLLDVVCTFALPRLKFSIKVLSHLPAVLHTTSCLGFRVFLNPKL
jgi:hypothetical protein